MKKQPIWVKLDDDLVIEKTQSILFLVGIVLLLLTGFDYLAGLIPFQLTNPNWQFQLIGKISNISWAPLLAFVCLFFHQSKHSVRARKIYFLRLLSWLALIIGIFHLLLLPLLVRNVYRIDISNQAAISQQIQQRTDQLQQIQTRIESVENDDLPSFLASLNRQTEVPKIDDPQAFKEQIISQVQQSEQQIKTQAETFRKNQRLELAKNAIQWSLVLIVSGFSFIWIWHLSKWARKTQISRDEKFVELETEMWDEEKPSDFLDKKSN